jgi:hypothetical protein
MEAAKTQTWAVRPQNKKSYSWIFIMVHNKEKFKSNVASTSSNSFFWWGWKSFPHLQGWANEVSFTIGNIEIQTLISALLCCRSTGNWTLRETYIVTSYYEWATETSVSERPKNSGSSRHWGKAHSRYWICYQWVGGQHDDRGARYGQRRRRGGYSALHVSVTEWEREFSKLKRGKTWIENCNRFVLVR